MKKFFALITVLLLFVACTKNPYIHRSQLILISPQQEIQIGLNAKQQILQRAKVSHNPYYNRLVKEVATRIAKVADEEFHPGYRWEFYVLESPQVNAFCLPGGKIFVYTGLLKLIDNPDQLAAVIGHEVAHAILRHGSERVSMAMIGEVGKKLLAQGLNINERGWGPLFDLAYGVTAQYGVLYPYSRKFEYEADKLGLYLMYKACYNPYEAIKFWYKMMQQSRKKVPEFLSTHPSDEHRIEALRKYIKELITIKRDCSRRF
ncbi:M48 family metallopeptidase [Nitratiruptor tergarcus]|uniref:Peptidase family M48 n=1 Tax=Nitratiruptor tergarcus DSM 16512 TaxID=1069081 RepID=A0A1W1WV30_9BACT|nr:M48 family metallopeptidase [Nitratiruptor tergarcus]SMC09583.1 Peptidase family M48 [Nitratiruptor tergarcus DSM 16512]